MKMICIFISLISFVCFAFNSEHWSMLKIPEYFPEPVYDFSQNPLSPSKIELGRMLFFDPLLSKDNSVSCASCHSPYNAFAHTDHDLSHGINDEIGTRNAPALFNLAWHSSFMWDGAINHLDMQPLAPINHPGEMGETTEHVVKKLQRSGLYPSMFKQAFNDSLITGEHLLKALAQFQLTLVSATSKYDKIQQGSEEFSAQEQSGYQLFKMHCNACHAEPLFSTFGFANNGLPTDTTLNDWGRWTATNAASDSLKFKIPSLRNLSFTFPYMHDGRFKKLSEVLQHYTSRIQSSETLADELKTPIRLNSNEKTDLIAFLLTLDDKDFVFDQKHQFPKEILLKAKE